MAEEGETKRGKKVLKPIADAFGNQILELLAGLLLTFVFAVLIYLLGLDVPPRGELPLIKYVLLFLQVNWKPILAFLVLLVFFAVLYRFYKYFQRLRVQDHLIKALGLLNFYPVSRHARGAQARPNPEVQQQAQERIVDAIRRATNVDMILVSGFKVIGTSNINGFLVPIMKEAQHARYRILILNPDWENETLKERASRLQRSFKTYVEGIREVLKFLAVLKFDENINIKVRVYNEVPVFQMFKTHEEIWVQTAVSYKTEQSPLIGFKPGDYSMYWPMERIWHRMWGDGGDDKDLDLRKFHLSYQIPSLSNQTAPKAQGISRSRRRRKGQQEPPHTSA